VFFETMENSDRKRQQWIEAASILAESPEAQVLCPSCLKAILIVEDEAAADPTYINRRLICRQCGTAEEIYFKSTAR
jgi:hypothetical protein